MSFSWGSEGLLQTYRNHRSEVLAVAWSPDGTRIASGDDDGIVQVWQAAGTCQCAPTKN
ncbi:MAG TPA: WD40 repeat domain-containing protein [Ktedonobacteraceae bacterium]|nr:WD40 repeat domain-containing protein [Ktedonobacteraceae bacterium]